MDFGFFLDFSKEGTLKKLSMVSTAILTAGFLSMGSAAQSQAPEPKNRYIIEEILVTAEKREVSLQRTAIAISAFTRERLERSQVYDLLDLQFMVPGFKASTGIAGKTTLDIRGVGNSVVVNGADPGIAVHMDGVFLSKADYFNAAFFDIERVEVLRGPQGTIYGRNATGGSINIISRDPTNDFSGYADVGVGKYNDLSVNFGVGGPIVEGKILGQFALLSKRHDGYTPNLFTGRDFDDQERTAARAKLIFIASDDVEIDLTTYISVDRGNGPSGLTHGSADRPGEGFFGGLTAGEFFGGTVVFDRRAVNYNSDDFSSTDTYGVNGNLRWNLDDLVLKVTTGYWKLDFDTRLDIDGTEVDYMWLSWHNNHWQYTGEVNLSSANGGRFNWQVGAFYFQDSMEEVVPGDGAVGRAFFGITVPILEFEATIEGKSYAVYGQAEYAFTDNLELSVGARLSYDKKSMSESLWFGGPVGSDQLSDNWSAFTPKVALSWHTNDNLMVYGSVSRGYKAGGFNGGALQGVGFDPEFVWNYEVGFKGRFLEQRLQLNAVAFYSEYEDMQQLQVGTVLSMISNAAAATIRGLELELRAQVTENFEIDSTFAYTNGEFDEYFNIDETRFDLGVQDLSGNWVPRSPRAKFNLGAQYRVSVGDWGDATLRGEYYWQDKMYFSEFNTDFMSQSEVGRFNASIRLDSADGHWNATVFGKNLGNKQQVGAASVIGAAILGHLTLRYLDPPRTYGIKLGHKF